MGDPILLVAKPWSGGLARYVFAALERRFPGEVRWIATYPANRAELARYRRDRQAWRQQVSHEIATARYRAALFINLPDDDGKLRERDNHVLWITDDPRLAEPTYRPYARVYVADPGYGEAVASLARERFAGVVPFALDARFHRPAPGPSLDQGACVIANRDPKRDRHLRALFRSGQRPLVVGNYFGRHPLFWRYPRWFRPRVANEAMGAIYARHAVSVNIHAKVVRGGTNMRTFECAGYGIAQLVERRPGLEDLFEPGTEIAVYDAPEEAPEALARLLAEPSCRARLCEQARRRGLAEHTYDVRISQLLDGVI